MKQKTIETIHEALKDQLVFAKSALKDIEAKKVQNGFPGELFDIPRIHEGVLKCAQERVSRTMEALDDWEAADFTLCGEEPETGCRCENAAAKAVEPVEQYDGEGWQIKAGDIVKDELGHTWFVLKECWVVESPMVKPPKFVPGVAGFDAYGNTTSLPLKELTRCHSHQELLATIISHLKTAGD